MKITAVPDAMAGRAGKHESPASSDACALASGVLHHAEACWRGDEGSRRFATRLGAYWRPQLPQAPQMAPQAFSPHGAGGHGIAWYEIDGDVLGYIPGSRAGYQVPRAAIPRLLECVPGQAERLPQLLPRERTNQPTKPSMAGVAA